MWSIASPDAMRVVGQLGSGAWSPRSDAQPQDRHRYPRCEDVLSTMPKRVRCVTAPTRTASFMAVLARLISNRSASRATWRQCWRISKKLNRLRPRVCIPEDYAVTTMGPGTYRPAHRVEFMVSPSARGGFRLVGIGGSSQWYCREHSSTLRSLEKGSGRPRAEH